MDTVIGHGAPYLEQSHQCRRTFSRTAWELKKLSWELEHSSSSFWGAERDLLHYGKTATTKHWKPAIKAEHCITFAIMPQDKMRSDNLWMMAGLMHYWQTPLRTASVQKIRYKWLSAVSLMLLDTQVKRNNGIQRPYQWFTEGQTHLIHVSTQSTAQYVFVLIQTSKIWKYAITYRK